MPDIQNDPLSSKKVQVVVVTCLHETDAIHTTTVFFM